MSLAASRPAFSPVLQRFRRSHEFWLLAVILALCLVLSLATDSFLTLQNFFDLLTSNAFVGILASGLLVVLIAGGIDISFTATASVAQYVALTLAIRYGLGWFAMFAGMDVPAASQRTQELLGWRPRGPGQWRLAKHIEQSARAAGPARFRSALHRLVFGGVSPAVGCSSLGRFRQPFNGMGLHRL